MIILIAYMMVKTMLNKINSIRLSLGEKPVPPVSDAPFGALSLKDASYYIGSKDAHAFLNLHTANLKKKYQMGKKCNGSELPYTPVTTIADGVKVDGWILGFKTYPLGTNGKHWKDIVKSEFSVAVIILTADLKTFLYQLLDQVTKRVPEYGEYDKLFYFLLYNEYIAHVWMGSKYPVPNRFLNISDKEPLKNWYYQGQTWEIHSLVSFEDSTYAPTRLIIRPLKDTGSFQVHSLNFFSAYHDFFHGNLDKLPVL